MMTKDFFFFSFFHTRDFPSYTVSKKYLSAQIWKVIIVTILKFSSVIVSEVIFLN